MIWGWLVMADPFAIASLSVLLFTGLVWATYADNEIRRKNSEAYFRNVPWGPR